MTWFYYLIAAGLGLIWGSFFNVVIYRTPRNEGLGSRSRCPGCGYTIRWYDNIPLLSFALLRGRCRKCSQPISWMYPLVELATGLLFTLMYWWSINVVPGLLGIEAGRPFVPELFIGILLVSVAVIATVVDVTHGIIPNRVVFPGILLMLCIVVGFAIYRAEPIRIASSLALAFGGSGFFLAAGLIYGAMFMKDRKPVKPSEYSMVGPEVDLESGEGEDEDGLISDEPPTGIGMGDVKLLFFTGLALGYFNWALIIIQLLLASFLGLIFAIAQGLGRKSPIPFGPFLAAGAIVALVWGQQLINTVLKLYR